MDRSYFDQLRSEFAVAKYLDVEPVPVGWFQLLRQLCADLQHWGVEWVVPGVRLQYVQISEQTGCMEFLISTSKHSGGTTRIKRLEEIREKYRYLSSVTCMRCGGRLIIGTEDPRCPECEGLGDIPF